MSCCYFFLLGRRNVCNASAGFVVVFVLDSGSFDFLLVQIKQFSELRNNNRFDFPFSSARHLEHFNEMHDAEHSARTVHYYHGMQESILFADEGSTDESQ